MTLILRLKIPENWTRALANKNENKVSEFVEKIPENRATALASKYKNKVSEFVHLHRHCGESVLYLLISKVPEGSQPVFFANCMEYSLKRLWNESVSKGRDDHMCLPSIFDLAMDRWNDPASADQKLQELSELFMYNLEWEQLYHIAKWLSEENNVPSKVIEKLRKRISQIIHDDTSSGEQDSKLLEVIENESLRKGCNILFPKRCLQKDPNLTSDPCLVGIWIKIVNCIIMQGVKKETHGEILELMGPDFLWCCIGYLPSNLDSSRITRFVAIIRSKMKAAQKEYLQQYDKFLGTFEHLDDEHKHDLLLDWFFQLEWFFQLDACNKPDKLLNGCENLKSYFNTAHDQMLESKQLHVDDGDDNMIWLRTDHTREMVSSRISKETRLRRRRIKWTGQGEATQGDNMTIYSALMLRFIVHVFSTS